MYKTYFIFKFFGKINTVGFLPIKFYILWDLILDTSKNVLPSKGPVKIPFDMIEVYKLIATTQFQFATTYQ